MKPILSIFLTLIVASLEAIAEEAPKDEAFILVTLLEATQSNDLIKFESVCDEVVKTVMTTETLKQVSEQLSPLMKDGYNKVYMGVLNRGMINTYYWKLDFDKESTPDMLAELSIKDGRVTGFFIR